MLYNSIFPSMPPKVSVNLCCFNGERYLDETLKSVCAQTYKDWELVVVNDGSTDSSERIIRRYVDQGWPIRYHHQPNSGLPRARNKCLELSSGALIGFIDQDDLWLPDKLARQVPLFEANPRVGFVYGDAVAFYEGTGRTFRYFTKVPPSRGNIFREQLRFYNINMQTVMVRRSALEDLAERFDPNLRLAEEADLFLRLLRRHDADFVPEVTVRYRLHDQMSSRRFVENWPGEQEYILEKLTRLFPDLQREYRSEIAAFKAKIGLRRAIASLERGDQRGARAALSPHLGQDWRYRVAYLAAFFPASVYHHLHFWYRRLSF